MSYNQNIGGYQPPSIGGYQPPNIGGYQPPDIGGYQPPSITPIQPPDPTGPVPPGYQYPDYDNIGSPNTPTSNLGLITKLRLQGIQARAWITQYHKIIQEQQDLFNRRLNYQTTQQFNAMYERMSQQWEIGSIQGTTTPDFLLENEYLRFYYFMLQREMAKESMYAKTTTEITKLNQQDIKQGLVNIGLFGLWLNFMAAPIGGTLQALPLSKLIDPWSNPIGSVLRRSIPGLAIALGMNSQLNMGLTIINSAGLVELPMPQPTEDGYHDKVPPVTIKTTEGSLSLIQTNKKQTITLDTSDKAEPRKHTKLYGGIRPYPRMAVPLDVPTYGGVLIDDPIPPVSLPHIRPLRLQVDILSPAVIQITRAEVTTKAATWTENRRNHDKKSKWQLQYNAMLRIAHHSLGTVSEVLDFKEAIMANIRVRIGGMWWNLESLTTESKKTALAGMASREYNFIVDWAGVGKSLLIMEASDRLVATMKQAETATMLESGLNNTFGNVSTWVNRGN